MSNKIRFSSNVKETFLAENASTYVSMHHRQSQAIEPFVQFIPAAMFKDYAVITDSNFSFIFKKFFNYVYNDVSIKKLSSNQRYWAIVKNMKNNKATIVYPDREGSCYTGDTHYYFRDGLFAASIYHQVHILNFVIVEPTASLNYTDVHIQEFKPPKIIKPIACKDAEDYERWRLENKELIWAYTLECEKAHKEKIKELEDYKVSCPKSEENEICFFSSDKFRDSNRNKTFLDFRASKFPELRALFQSFDKTF